MKKISSEVKFRVMGKSIEKTLVAMLLKVTGCKRMLHVVVTPYVAKDTVKVMAGRYALVHDMEGVVDACRLFKQNDRRFWWYQYPWSK